MMHLGMILACCIKCAYLLQGDPLYMGVPTGGFCSLFWLLLLQCDVADSTDAPPLLGCSHITNGLQVYLQQGVFIGVSMCIVIYVKERNV